MNATSSHLLAEFRKFTKRLPLSEFEAWRVVQIFRELERQATTQEDKRRFARNVKRFIALARLKSKRVRKAGP